MTETDYTEHNEELQKDFEGGCLRVFIAIFAVVAIAIACILAGCKVCEPITKIEYRDSVRVEQRFDSIFVKETDSIAEKTFQKGDTIYLTKEKFVTRWRERIVERHDTITKMESRSETVAVKYVPPFYKWAVGILAVIVLVFLVWVVFRIYKRFYLR